jgi:hypothetical protein
MTARPLPNRRQAIAVCAAAALTALVCAALMAAAALVPAPPAIVPLVALVCIGCPVLAVWDLPVAIAVLRSLRWRSSIDGHAVTELRRELDALPETDHPLGH